MKKDLSALKEARFNAILDSATILLVENPTASMNEIAEYAGIGIATLHRYVESREKLMLFLGHRAIQLVSDTVNQIPLDEERSENYIPELIEALIPLGDKIYFLGHDASVFNNKELGKAEEKLREPLRRVIELLQQRGYFQQTVSSEWILNTLYALLFHTWEQVHEGNVAKKSAAELVLNTFYYGFKAKDDLRGK
ncbi:TetR/AcrR family transcriptional regulator [Bacillus thuringiensis]|uniref:TetR/AcrR family transcriptional regulator n=7 Tax=Bacillus cereus group TaxID=86661 RepID=A0A9W7Q0Z7_BACCE|nr:MULTISPECIES: TetR/AcrR family transcriptional regulator [Bacillus]MED1157553.1 TetR/AcrR family transcriptional regulator [Bacillus paranthracis]ACK94347.1 transcriptional regulator, TetR family [Bacillus cereus G9842]AFQ25578.1 TetR family transcriptional regulator [Bacillus thuringiensis HD-789]AJH08341.1 bacterial regulatory s, tetR family protein [Bacillus thuringiensis HD1002]AND23770.1 TetR family transcriptional regulator [Bacillus thuringiensis serovar israelensis]